MPLYAGKYAICAFLQNMRNMLRSHDRYKPVSLASSRSISTFGNGVVKLYGPVPLSITLCGVSLTHPFYLVDDRAVSLSHALGGYE